MKRTILFSAAVLALAMFSSCQKPQTPSQTEDVTEFTATIDNTAKRDTKTSITIEGNVGKIEWCKGDEITVTDGAGAKAIYVAQSSGPRTMFLIKDGETPLGAGPYTAAYGDINRQTYSAVGANCPLFVASATTEFQFKCELAILKITASSTVAKTVKSVEVSGGTSVTLDCGTTGVDLSSGAKDFYVAINPGTYTNLKVTFTATDNTVAETSRTSSIELKANDLLPLNRSLENWKALPPEGALPGEFSVSATKQVQFSKGNLYYDGSKFNFETNQYKTQDSWSTSHVSHFYWSKTASVAYAETYSESGTSGSDVFFTNADGFTVNVGGKERSGWRTLSTAEWQYLFNYGSYASEIRKDRYKYGVTVCNKTNCVVIAPDDWNLTANPLQESYGPTSTPMTWEQAEAAGLVCLPAAGLRSGSDVNNVGDYGRYWSSTARDSYSAYYVIFASFDVIPDDYDYRLSGFSVRLITESK